MAGGSIMKKIGILCHANHCCSPDLAEEVAGWLAARGVDSWIYKSLNGEVRTDDLQDTDLVISLGGDGSILRAARAAAPFEVPILGINLGRVGFLTESEPEHWQEVLGRVLAGDYWIERRMMLHVVARRDGKRLAESDALNDVVVGRGSGAYVVHLGVDVDGGFMATYVADALIVATPTGSTGYALAAGGPVMPPELRNILVIPVAAHLSLERPIVLSEGVEVRVRVLRDRPAVLSVDGEADAELVSGDEVVVAASRYQARFARVQDRAYFYRTLVRRLVPRNDED